MTAEDEDRRDDDQDAPERQGRTEADRDADDERVKQRGQDDPDTPGVADARPGRQDIGETHMPSDYHQAVKERPVEVKLPETPDLSEDGSEESREDADGEDKAGD